MPGAPRDVSVTAGLGSLTVSWQPAASGGEPDGWEVHYSYRAGVGPSARTVSSVHRVSEGAVPAEGVTLENLMPGKAYTIKVRATSAAGSGSYSAPVTATPLAAATLVGLEVTQGLQDWEGSIKLVKGKKTVVRAFLEPYSGQETTLKNIRLEAVLKQGSTETVVDTIGPVNSSNSYRVPSMSTRVHDFLTRPGAAGRRAELNASANFELTDPRWIGDKTYSHDFNITYRLMVDDVIVCSEAVKPENSCEADLTFKPVKQPKVRMVGITIRNSPSSDPIKLNRVHLEEQAMRIESLMPIPKLDYELRTLQTIIDPPPDTNDDLAGLLADLLYARANDKDASVYLGVLKGTSAGGLAGVLSNSAVWYTGGDEEEGDLGYARNRGAHEFGHVIGARHSAYELEVRYDLQTVGTEMQTICSDPTSEEARVKGEVSVYPYLLAVTTTTGASESWAALGPVGSSATTNTEMWGLDTRFARNGPDELVVRLRYSF